MESKIYRDEEISQTGIRVIATGTANTYSYFMEISETIIVAPCARLQTCQCATAQRNAALDKLLVKPDKCQETSFFVII